MKELASKFYAKVTAEAIKIMNDFKISFLQAIGANAGTCNANDDPNRIYPWNDKSLWSKADDRLITSAFDGKLKLTDNQKTWLKIIPTNNPNNPGFGCRICQDHLRRNPHLQPEQYGDFAKPGGTFLDENKTPNERLLYWRSKILKHETPYLNDKKQLRNHARIIIRMKNLILEPPQSYLKNVQGNFDLNQVYTSRVFLTAYTVVKKHISFRLFPTLIKLLQSSRALPPTIKHNNRRSFGRIVNTISRHMRSRLIQTLKIKQPPVSIILDTSSVKQCRQYLLVFIQITVDVIPKVYLYNVTELTGEKSLDMKTALLDAFEKDGITKVIKDNLIGFTSDGASNMVGIRGGLGK
uniref:DUF4371 domain-containing protein n=1 Tax=Panagrolaimus sp. ES5 TaxID=591445 RepID=A0AC34FGI9_9BILA